MSDQNDKLPNAWHAEYLKASDRAIAMERERDELRAENSHLRMENGLAEFHKLNDQNAELLSRFSKLAELLGFPIGGEYCALEKAIRELMREKAEAIGDLAVCEERAQTMERDYEATIARNKMEIEAMQSQLSRICKEGFNNDDTIGGEPADDYVLRQLAKIQGAEAITIQTLRAQLEACAEASNMHADEAKRLRDAERSDKARLDIIDQNWQYFHWIAEGDYAAGRLREEIDGWKERLQ